MPAQRQVVDPVSERIEPGRREVIALAGALTQPMQAILTDGLVSVVILEAEYAVALMALVADLCSHHLTCEACGEAHACEVCGLGEPTAWCGHAPGPLCEECRLAACPHCAAEGRLAAMRHASTTGVTPR